MGSAIAPALAAVIAKTALADLEGRARLLPRPSLIALGEASYALYITHFPVMMAIRHLIGTDPNLTVGARFAIVLVVIGLSVALSLLVFRYFERPLMRRWSSGRNTSRPQAADSVPASAS